MGYTESIWDDMLGSSDRYSDGLISYLHPFITLRNVIHSTENMFSVSGRYSKLFVHV